MEWTKEQLREFVLENASEAVKSSLTPEVLEQIVTPLMEKFSKENIPVEAIKSVMVEKKKEEQAAKEAPLMKTAKLLSDAYGISQGQAPQYHKDVNEMHRVDKAGLATGVDSTGGYLVPTEESRELLSVVMHNAPAVSRCRNWPMSTGTMTIPTVAGGVTVSWVPEALAANLTGSVVGQSTGLKPATTQTYGQVTLTKSSAVAQIIVTRNLLKYSLPAVESALRTEVPGAIADAYDNAIFDGGAVAATDPITGLDSLITTNTSDWNAASPYDGFIDFLTAPEVTSDFEADTWFGNISAMKTVMKIVDGEGRNIFAPELRTGNLPTIFGVSPVKDKNIVSTYGDGTQTRAYCGPFGQHAHVALDPSMFVLVNPYRYAEMNAVQFIFEIGFAFAVTDESLFAYHDAIPV